jgi:hypothetical protein
MTNEENNDDFKATADGSSTVTPSPLAGMRQYCLMSTNGSAHEVKLCPAKSCSIWPFRFGQNPTPDMRTEIANIKVYPKEDKITWAEFFENGGTRLDAIERKCLDCSGGSKSEVRNCWDVTCGLHPFRLGHNPNRAMGPEQREAAAARLKANVERAKGAASVDDRNSPTHIRKKR